MRHLLSPMDKKTIKVVSVIAAFAVAFVLIFVLIFNLFIADKPKPEIEEEKSVGVGEMNGVWIASVINIDFPSATDLSADELKREIDSIVETTANAGLDTIFFQVRPAADALYRSEIFPVSKYLSTDGELPLDCLEYIIEKAKEKNISVHAWVNPLRVLVSGDVDSLPDGHPAKENPNWCVKYADNKTYFDCGVPSVRELIARGVAEIAENYDVAGVVFDDYFYPYPVYETTEDGVSVIAEFDDSETFSKYGAGEDDIGDWRRSNVNEMVRLCHEAIKEANEETVFGIAPFGIWKNADGGPMGSATRGAQSYYDIYCDTIAFAENGWVDYIAPQIYWSKEESVASFNALCDWWSERLLEHDVGFYICNAAYRYSPDEAGAWSRPHGIMTDQVKYAREKENYLGSIFYGYSEIYNNVNGIADELKELYLD